MSTSDSHAVLPFVFVDYATHPLDALAKDIIALEKSNPSDLSQITIWCESRAVIHTIKLRLLDAAQAANINGLLFPNITMLQDWIWQQQTPDQVLISETNKQLLLVEAIRHSPGLFQTNNAWPLAKELVSLFNECTLAQIPLSDGIEALREVLLKGYNFPQSAAENISRESEIVYQLWQAYREQIEARQWIDPIDYYCQCLVSYKNVTPEQHYYMVGKHRFCAAEALFFDSIAKQSNLSIYSPKVSSDQFGSHHHPHLRIVNQDSTLITVNNSREQLLDIVYDKKAHSYERIQQIKDTFPDNAFTKWLSMYTCSSVERHVKAICLQAKKWLLEDQHPIGIIVNDRLLARRIRAVLEGEGIKPTDMGGWTLSTTSAATSIEVLLDAVESSFKRDSLLDLLGTPFLPLNYKQNSSYRDQLYQIRKALKKHKNIPTDNLDTFINFITQYADAKECDCSDILAACNIIKETSTFIQKCSYQGEYELFKLSSGLLELLDSIGIQQCLLGDAAGKQLLNTLKNNINSTKDNSIKINWKEWRQWLRDLFENNYYIPEGTDDRITLCGLEHIDNLSFNSAIIAGVEENRLTSSKTHRTFFNEKVRYELHLSTTHESNAINFVRFRQLLQQCDRLLLSAETESRGEPQEICSWVKLIELFCEQAYSQSLHNTELDQLIAQHDQFKSHNENFTFDKTTRPNPIAPADSLPTRISATQYQSLIDCPYQYFAKYILGLRDQDSTDEFEASDFGKLVHRSLHEFHFSENNKTGSSFTTSNRTLLIEQLINTSSLLFKRAMFPSSVKEGWLQRWLTNVPAYIDWAVERSKDWSTLRGECTLEFKLDNGVTLYGQIDRLDSDTNSYAVVDYKTGSSKPSKKNVMNGETVQLPFYALLDERITQAEYLSLGSQGEAKSTALLKTEELEELKSDHLSRLQTLLIELNNGASLPAHGDNRACRICDYEGLCRKSHWT